MLRYLISASGLSDDAVTLEFKSEASEVAAVLAEDPNAIGLLPQPFVTAAIAQNDSLSVVLDLTKVWDSLQEDGSNSRLVTGVSIVNNEFLAAHKDLVDTFLTEHEASIAYTAADPEGVAALIEKGRHRRKSCHRTESTARLQHHLSRRTGHEGCVKRLSVRTAFAEPAVRWRFPAGG